MITGMHVGRHWTGCDIEDRCPCDQAPCGLVISGRTDPTCIMHAAGRSLRQGHPAGECPGRRVFECTATISGLCLRETQSETACITESNECAHRAHPEKEKAS